MMMLGILESLFLVSFFFFFYNFNHWARFYTIDSIPFVSQFEKAIRFALYSAFNIQFSF